MRLAAVVRQLRHVRTITALHFCEQNVRVYPELSKCCNRIEDVAGESSMTMDLLPKLGNLLRLEEVFKTELFLGYRIRYDKLRLLSGASN